MRSASPAALLFAVPLLLAGPLPAEGAGDPPPAPPAAQDQGVPSPARIEKARRLVEALRWMDGVRSQVKVEFNTAEAMGQLPAGFGSFFQQQADWKGLEKKVVAEFARKVDEGTMDAALAFLATPGGRKLADALPSLHLECAASLFDWKFDNATGLLERAADHPEELKKAAGEAGLDLDSAPLRQMREMKMRSNETAALATLRNLASCQAQIQTSGKIDCDRDGIGEYGTFLEMTGSVPVRKGLIRKDAGTGGFRTESDFSERGTPVNPPILSPALSGVDAAGTVVKAGYRFRIFLPDSAATCGWVHETGPRESVGLEGGTGRICVDLSETMWCAYAWPDERGKTGNRAFFVCQSGDVFQSANETGKWSGDRGPPGNSAYQGGGITSALAVGTRGNDGDLWKVTN